VRSCQQVCFVSLREGSLRVDELFVPAIEFFEHAKNADPSTIGGDELASLGPLVSDDSKFPVQIAGHLLFTGLWFCSSLKLL